MFGHFMNQITKWLHKKMTDRLIDYEDIISCNLQS